MGKEIDLTQVQKLIEKAEESVSVVKDPNLRPTAFENILNILLHGVQISGEGAKRMKGLLKTPKVEGREGTTRWLQELKDEGLFEKPKNAKEILTKLAERGHHLRHSDLTWPLQYLVIEKKLRRKKQVPSEGGKSVWHYSNW